MITGLDISRWQLQIDFAKMASSDARFCIARATVGFAEDRMIRTNMKGLQAHNIPYSVYHAFKTDRDPHEQANLFWEIIGIARQFGHEMSFPPAVDVEEETHHPMYSNNLKAFCNHFWLISGWRPMIYTRKNIWETYVEDDTDEWASRYDLWVASWGVRPPPYLPDTWNTWLLWQDGTVPGSPYGVGSTTVDHNIYNGSPFQFFWWLLMSKFSRWIWNRQNPM
jgi:GH25 family lysozyme M1 (1,4-beta-N-acetylmuramidase)